MSALTVHLHGSRVGVLEEDERGFLRFTYSSATADAHGKDYPMIYASGERRLALLYDLVSAVA